MIKVNYLKQFLMYLVSVLILDIQCTEIETTIEIRWDL